MDPEGVPAHELGSACSLSSASDGCFTSAISRVERRMSGLDRALASLTKSSSMLDDPILRLSAAEDVEGLDTLTAGTSSSLQQLLLVVVGS